VKEERKMKQLKEELTKAGIPYVSECLGGNIEGLRVGSMYVMEHGSGKGYYFGTLEDESDACYTLREVVRLAKHEEEMRKMEQKLREIFNLKWIQEFTEANIHDSEWIEEDYDGEKRRILEVTTLVHGAHGAYIPGMVLELFGEAEGYDLEDPYNYELNATIHETLMFVENDINECLNRLLPSKGRYYVGYHEADGSYCLFYEEYEEEAEQV
jgi:hypothetical protein